MSEMVWALVVVSVVCSLSTVGCVFVLSRMFLRLMRHTEDMVQIGGTPVGMAKAQTEYEMKRAEQHAAEQQAVVEKLRAAAEGRDSDRIEEVLS